MLSERTQTRLVLVIWGCLMVVALGLQDVVFWIIAAVGAAVLITVAVRRWRVYSAEVDAQRRAAAQAEEELLERMQRQHKQASQGDPRGVYGEGYAAMRRYEQATRPRMPADDERPPAEAGGVGWPL